ncbi:MAG TPA: serine/threonine-protein kinase [Polyangiaceae bacterium]|nr:serine/threonine-protein kinase [Polyangiaceae bacterium]
MAPAVQAGDILCDRYRVDRVLGAGGMGVVVLAEHIELRERVAIKFLLDSAAEDPELSERFLREARAAVKIRSEHVVRVSDVGRLPSGAPYLVMEYLEGEDLGQRLERGPVPIEDAVDYVIQCCEAMHVAHRSGIVHRDLKPANLFLSQRPDGSPIIKVLDFGISKVAGPEAQQLSLTRTQAMMGSPLYMSPEQMRSSKDVGPATDIWALGVILHELISGDVPFSGSAVTEVLVKVMQDAPPRLRALRPEVPEALEAAVLRCLAKSPGERFPTVAALAVALTPFASGQTLGLQRRLHAANLNEPAPATTPGDEKRFAATRVEAAGAAPPAGAAQVDIVAATPELPAPAQTQTGWAGASSALPRAAAIWRRRLPWLAGAAGLALVGAVLLARIRETPASHQEGPLPVPAAAASPPNLPPAPTAASTTPAPIAPSPAAAPPAPSEAPPASPAAAAPSAAPTRSLAKRAPARVSRAPQPAPTGAHPAPASAAAAGSAETFALPHPPSVLRREPTTDQEPAGAAPPARAATAPARPRSLSIEFK